MRVCYLVKNDLGVDSTQQALHQFRPIRGLLLSEETRPYFRVLEPLAPSSSLWLHCAGELRIELSLSRNSDRCRVFVGNMPHKKDYPRGRGGQWASKALIVTPTIFIQLHRKYNGQDPGEMPRCGDSPSSQLLVKSSIDGLHGGC